MNMCNDCKYEMTAIKDDNTISFCSKLTIDLDDVSITKCETYEDSYKVAYEKFFKEVDGIKNHYECRPVVKFEEYKEDECCFMSKIINYIKRIIHIQ